MSKYLADILETNNNQFQGYIDYLEKITLGSGVDIKLTAELKTKTSSMMRILKLDQDDTSDHEVYHALKAKLLLDEDLLSKKLKLNDNFQKTIIDHCSKKIKNNSTWAVKKTVLRQILRKNPPTKLAKHLGYRSVESMIKNENINLLIALLPYSQPKTWFDKFNSQLAKLGPADFESRKIEYILLPPKRWSDLDKVLSKAGHYRPMIVPSCGALAIPPMPNTDGARMLFLALLLNSINDLRAISFYIKLIHMLPDFGDLYSSMIKGSNALHIKLGEDEIPWQLVQRLYSSYPADLEPFIQEEDLDQINIEMLVDDILGGSDFWNLTSLVCWQGDSIISADLCDLSANTYFGLDIKKSSKVFVHKHIAHELMYRYLRQPQIKGMIDTQLDTLLNPNQTISIS